MKLPIICAALLGSAALVSSSCTGTERTEAVTAEITAAQMQGRNAAKLFLNPQIGSGTNTAAPLAACDTLHKKFLDAGKPQCAEAFDSAVVRTVRAVRPELESEVAGHFKSRNHPGL